MRKRYFGHIPIPLQRVHVELTNVCEFDCLFCPKSQMKRPFGFMETDLAKETISLLGRHGICEKVTLHVMGEPTLHRDFFQILSHAETKHVNIGLTTNGRNLGTPVGKELLKHPLYQIDVSLQTPDEESFTLRRARAVNFNDYLSGILDFFFSYHQRHPETIFKFRFLNTRFQKKGMEKKTGPLKIISSTSELRRIFGFWADRLLEGLGADEPAKKGVARGIGKLVSYKWNVVEIHPNLFFETYVLDDWGHAFDERRVIDAWGGFCFGMRDHFAVLHNGDVTLCCIDYEGKTAIGNLHNSSLEEILSSDLLGDIIKGFRKFRPIHPYCKKCLGSTGAASWVFKPVLSVLGLKLLKPYLYSKVKLTS
ncbi:MAG: radical SAM protein [Deltaproteobacteria bacterium RBG_13_49_15]|nr:MAG: radical SAM protein [Deltaproteobacteria bacterium RBG_13_49_15]